MRFEGYGGPEVLRIVQVPEPVPGQGQVLVRTVVAPVNPGEIGIREGAFAGVWPATFPEGQGNDFAGWVVSTGAEVTGFVPGDEVIGFAPRAAQADHVVLDAAVLAHKPAGISWEEAAPVGVDAYIDSFGRGNVDTAITLGVPAHRINTVADPMAVRRYGVHGRAQEDAFSPALVAELADLVARGLLVVPINTVYPLERVAEAYVELARRHTRGKIVLSLVPEADRERERRALFGDRVAAPHP